jgi:hypothetical protein
MGFVERGRPECRGSRFSKFDVPKEGEKVFSSSTTTCTGFVPISKSIFYLNTERCDRDTPDMPIAKPQTKPFSGNNQLKFSVRDDRILSAYSEASVAISTPVCRRNPVTFSYDSHNHHRHRLISNHLECDVFSIIQTTILSPPSLFSVLVRICTPAYELLTLGVFVSKTQCLHLSGKITSQSGWWPCRCLRARSPKGIRLRFNCQRLAIGYEFTGSIGEVARYKTGLMTSENADQHKKCVGFSRNLR